MTISEAITMANTLKPNQYDEKTLIGWLKNIDKLIYREVILTHEGHEEYEEPSYSVSGGMDAVLLAEEPYDELYPKYLMAMIDYQNAEYARYVNSMSMFNAAYEDFEKAYNRTHMPLQPNIIVGVR